MSKITPILETMNYGPAPEDKKLAEAWLDSHQRTFGIYVDGAWNEGAQHFSAINPATKTELAQITQASTAQVDQAVAAARRALPEWQAKSGTERAAILYALARQVQKHSRLFAVLESMDNGKPIRETRDLDIPLVARHFYYHAGWATLAEQDFADYEPVGVCGQIIPWNFPLLMLSWKIAPALAMGNCVVLKPAESTSLTALLFAEICQAAGVPNGVVNILTGDGEVGKQMVQHPDIDKIAFTGSTEVGRIIRNATSESHKKISLELGGKSPFIVFEDADLDSAIEGLVDAIWFNQGQVCCAGSRLLVQEGIAERTYAKLRARMENLRVGDPLDKAIDIGAIIDENQLNRIDSLVETGVQEGATKFQPHCKLPENGWFYPPTLLTEVEPASTVAQIEIFGPVLVAMTFRTPAEAVALANNTPYGLASSVWTQNLDVAHDVASQIKAGTVWINCTNQFDASCGFGGYRESGYGREGGREGLFEYLRWKAPQSAPSKSRPKETAPESPTEALDRTHKLYIGGKQCRPDGGYSFKVGHAEFALANRKDVRNAVEAATGAATAWAKTGPFQRSQILYYLAENLVAAKQQLVAALQLADCPDPEAEFLLAADRIFWYAAWADKYEGVVHQPAPRMMTYTRPEPIGVLACFAPNDHPLLGFLSLCLPAFATGNAVVAVASETNPLPAAELIRLLDSSDVPAGTWNILTGRHAELIQPIGEHLGVDAVWHFGVNDDWKKLAEYSSGNLKQTWSNFGEPLDWSSTPSSEFLRRSTQIKNVWVPYGA